MDALILKILELLHKENVLLYATMTDTRMDDPDLEPLDGAFEKLLREAIDNGGKAGEAQP